MVGVGGHGSVCTFLEAYLGYLGFGAGAALSVVSVAIRHCASSAEDETR
jgi:hypothetical protein